MITEIITETHEHFEWRTDENGEPYKFKLSDNLITKKVKVTKNENGEVIARENYIEPQPLNISQVDISTLSEDQIQALKTRLGL
jgi:hypothetical protein